MSDLTDGLRAVVGQATPGPWGVEHNRWLVSGHPAMHRRSLQHVDSSGWEHDGDLDYIVTFDPVVTAALLDVVDAAEAAVWEDDDASYVALDGAVTRFREVAAVAVAVRPAV